MVVPNILIISTFKHSAYLELALNLLEQKGISKNNLLVAPLQKPDDTPASELQAAHQNGKSPVDKAFIFAMIFMLLGAIYGFVLEWGPIIWALIGIVVGAVAGLAWEYISKSRQSLKSSTSESEVVLIIECDNDHSNIVEEILWKHQALGISKIGMNSEC